MRRTSLASPVVTSVNAYSLALLAVVLAVVPACRPAPQDGMVEVRIDKSNDERLMRLFAGAVDGAAGDSLLTFDDNRLLLDVERTRRLTGIDPDANRDGLLDWEPPWIC